MTKTCGDRIVIAEFIRALQKVSFDELTEEKCRKLFANHDFQYLNTYGDTSKDIAIDDYVFKVYLHTSDDEAYNFSGFRINDMFLSNHVDVFLPSDSEGSRDITASGTIKYIDDIYSMIVVYCID